MVNQKLARVRRYVQEAATRDLNYASFFAEGDHGEIDLEGYTPSNTHQLDKDELETLLLSLHCCLCPRSVGSLMRGGAAEIRSRGRGSFLAAD